MKTIKLVTVVDGEPVTVGRCHPGQARILQKQGLAEWKDGKLWFKTPFPAVRENFVIEDGGIRVEISKEEWDARGLSVSQTRTIEEIRDTTGKVVELKAVPGSTETTVKWKDNAPVSWADWMNGDGRKMFEDELAEIDPDGLVQGSNRPYPEHHTCVSLGEWFKQIMERRKLGHELGVADDPRCRTLGFIDVNDNLVFTIGLSALKRATDEDYMVLGHPEEVREWMRTAEGRCQIVGDDLMMGCLDPLRENDPEVPEDLWESPPPHPLVKDPSFLHLRRMLPPLANWGTFKWPEDREVILLLTGDPGEPETLQETQPPADAMEWGYFRRFYMCIARIWKVGPKYILEVGEFSTEAPGYVRKLHGSYSKLEGAERRAMLYAKEIGEKATTVTTPDQPAP